MRVLVLAGIVGDLGPSEAGAAIAGAWADLGHQVAVVPIARTGPETDAVVADLTAGDGSTVVVRAECDSGTTVALGQAVVPALESGHPDEIWLDLTVALPVDGGAGLLAALGARAAVPLDAGPGQFVGVEQVDLRGVRQMLARVRLVGLVDPDDVGRPLLGVRGAAGQAGFAIRDVERVLAIDRALESLSRALGFEAPPEGAGAGSSVALAVLALGGRIETPAAAIAARVGLDATLAQADLVVLAVDALDFGGAGVEMVLQAGRWAAASLVPCIVVGRAIRVSSRELRTYGVESAYGLTGVVADRDHLRQLAEGVARSWSW